MKNEYKNIRLIDFIRIYSFNDYRECEGRKMEDCRDTKIIRIIDTDIPKGEIEYNREEWFEFGLNDYYDTEAILTIAKKFLNKDILNKYVTDINYDDDFGRITISLNSDENECYWEY